MAEPLFSSPNYEVLLMRGGGILIRRKFKELDQFIQPGDDAKKMLDVIDALDEIPIRKRETLFDMICSEYF